MKQQQQQSTSITAFDTMRYSTVVEKVCKYAPMTQQGYLNILFETGCELVESKFAGDTAAIDRLLQDERYCFWAWFLIEYVRHDEALQNTKIPYRRYESYKKMWLATYRLQNALEQFCKHHTIK